MTICSVAAERSGAQNEYKEFSAAKWREHLATNDYAVTRRRAAYVLGRLQSADQSADAQALAAALKDRDLVVRWYAADSLGRLGPIAKSAIPKMTAGLTDPTNDKDVRRNLAKSLGRIGVPDSAAIKQLETDLASEDQLYARAAAEALVRLNQHQAAFSKLLDIAASTDDIAVFDALQSLLSLSDVKSAPLNKLQPLLKHANSDVRRAAARLIGQQGWDAVDQVLNELQSGAPPATCLAALRYATSKQPKDDFKAVQVKAINAAWQRIGDRNEGGPTAQAILANQGALTLTSLWAAWNSNDEPWREAANTTIEKWLRANQPAKLQGWSAAAPQILKDLNQSIKAEDKITRRLALWLLAELPLPIDDIDQEAVRSALRDADVFNRRNAASILRRKTKSP